MRFRREEEELGFGTTLFFLTVETVGYVEPIELIEPIKPLKPFKLLELY